MIGSEDLALAKHGILIITSGDLVRFFQKSSGSSDFMMKISEQSVMSVPSFQINLFQNGAAKASPGGLWAFDMREGGGKDPVRFENFSADM